MSIQPYVGPTPGSNNGAIVALTTAQEITPEEYERRQKEVSFSSFSLLLLSYELEQRKEPAVSIPSPNLLLLISISAVPGQSRASTSRSPTLSHVYAGRGAGRRSSNSSQRRFQTGFVKSWAPMLELAAASSTCTEWCEHAPVNPTLSISRSGPAASCSAHLG